MKRFLVPPLFLAFALPAPAQTGLNMFRLFGKATRWFEGYRYTDTTHGAEVVQGFPCDRVPGIRRIDGVYFSFFDTDLSVVKTYDIFIRKDRGGKPDLVSPPLYSFRVTTRKLSGRGPSYPISHFFPAPFRVPPGTRNLWIGVHFGPDKTPTSQVWFGALARHGKNGRPGVLSRKGVPNPRLAYVVPYAGGKPTGLVAGDDAWVWTTGILTRDPILLPYVQLNTDIPPHQGGSLAGKKVYGMAALWPDIANAEGLPAPGRHDALGWRVVQAWKKSPTHTLTAFLFLQNKRMPRPVPTPFGNWFLGRGGPFEAVGAFWSPLTNGSWTLPAIQVPAQARPYLVGTFLYAQAALLETDPSWKVVGASLTNMVAMDL